MEEKDEIKDSLAYSRFPLYSRVLSYRRDYFFFFWFPLLYAYLKWSF